MSMFYPGPPFPRILFRCNVDLDEYQYGAINHYDRVRGSDGGPLSLLVIFTCPSCCDRRRCGSWRSISHFRRRRLGVVGEEHRKETGSGAPTTSMQFPCISHPFWELKRRPRLRNCSPDPPTVRQTISPKRSCSLAKFSTHLSPRRRQMAMKERVILSNVRVRGPPRRSLRVL